MTTWSWILGAAGVLALVVLVSIGVVAAVAWLADLGSDAAADDIDDNWWGPQ